MILIRNDNNHVIYNGSKNSGDAIYDHRNRTINEEKSDNQQDQDRRQSVSDTSQLARNPIRAKKGYHGVIDHPSMFLVGEYGKEMVDISAVKKQKKHRDYNDYDLSDFLKGYNF